MIILALACRPSTQLPSPTETASSAESSETGMPITTDTEVPTTPGGYDPVRLYVGSGDGNIYVYDVDGDGQRVEVDVEDAGANPSFLAFSPISGRLYAVDESSGEVAAFTYDDDGALTALNRASSSGSGPAHLAVDATAQWLVAANYGSGTVTTVHLETDGSLGAAGTTLFTGQNAHQVVFSKSNAYVYVPNLGANTVSVLAFGSGDGSLVALADKTLTLPAGAGPRHLAFHPNHPFAWVLNELDDTLLGCTYDAAAGTLAPLQTITTLPDGVDGASNTAAEVAVSPDGRFVYASNRGDDSVAIYAYQPDGRLVLQGHSPTLGATPRHMSFSPSGDRLFVANQGSNRVTIFAVDPDIGALVAQRTMTVPAPAYAGAVSP
jgi:6-phosphogluconolactonase